MTSTSYSPAGIAYDRAGPRAEPPVVLLHAGIADRRMWGAMRMTPTDLSDVNATTYTYLMNGATAVCGMRSGRRSPPRATLSGWTFVGSASRRNGRMALCPPWTT